MASQEYLSLAVFSGAFIYLFATNPIVAGYVLALSIVAYALFFVLFFAIMSGLSRKDGEHTG